MSASPSIFISYRVADSQPQAGRLFDALERAFGTGTAFYDKDGLKPGMKWPDELAQKVKKARVVLVLIADLSKWIGVGVEGRRIDDPDDWVRLEVEHALADTQKLVIPVLLNNAQLPTEKGLPESCRGLLKCQLINITDANWARDLAPLLARLREHLGIPEDPQNRQQEAAPKEAHIHKYTINRDEQKTRFDDSGARQHHNRPHFYYLYGQELQAHRSFFQRIRLELEGAFLAAAGVDTAQKTEVVAVDFVLESEGCHDQERLRERFLRNLFTAFGLNPDEHNNHPLTGKRLTDLLAQSHLTRSLPQGSYVCVFAHISHWYWHPTLTPEAARWFAEVFCPPELPADKPTVLFFLAFDFDEPTNPGIRKAVLEVVREEARHFVDLTELDMVKKRHLAQWMVRYPKAFSVPLRNQILELYFNPPEKPYYMEDMEPIVQKLIDDHFNRQT
jgi:hypothetical protein